MSKTFRKINALSFAKLIAALRIGGMNYDELAEEIGLHPQVVAKYCRALHAEGEVFIEFYEEDSKGRQQRPCFKLGQGKDAKRRRIPAAERQRTYRQNLRKKREALVIQGVMRIEKTANGRFRFVANDEKEAA